MLKQSTRWKRPKLWAVAYTRVLALACLGAGAGIAAEAQDVYRFFVREYRVTGATKLSGLEIEQALYPYMGPYRSADDVEQARQKLETTYRDKGYQTVSVTIPQQDPSLGIIRFEVIEGRVSRTRVKGAKYHLPSRVRAGIPSLAEGSVPNMNDVRREILALNRQRDRSVRPELRSGEEMGTFEVDLIVDDKLPLHGSLELNNRYSPNTSRLRLNGSLSYGNMFQLGHTVGFNFQVAPEEPDDALVYSGNYLARVSDDVSLLFSATRQDSDVSTLGGGSVVGKGNIYGVRALFDLPGGEGFLQSFSLGIDAKRFKEDILVGGGVIAAPIEYYPISANYSATKLHGEQAFTEANLSLVLNLRGVGSDTRDFANKRFNADGAFVVLKADASHTRDLRSGSQVYGKIQGQLANKPLINSEQFAGGGLGSTRGYLESTALGDNALFITAEYRTPSLLGSGVVDAVNPDEWRFHAFVEAGVLQNYDTLPGQRGSNTLSSVGVGTRVRYREHFNTSIDVACPLETLAPVERGDVRVTFRGWLDF